jgi:hypothetical protein
VGLLGLAFTAFLFRVDTSNLYTVTLFQERIASICADYGLVPGYTGDLAIRGWPIGVRVLKPHLESFIEWQVISNNPDPRLPIEGLGSVVFTIRAYDRLCPDEIAVCVVNGKRLHVSVDAKEMDELIPQWSLSKEKRGAGITFRKLLKKLEGPPKNGCFKGNVEEAKMISLNDLNLFHFRLTELADQADLVCVYYRGDLGRHQLLGRGGFRLPEATNPGLTWTLTNLEDTFNLNQHVICQLSASPTKQKGSIATYSINGKPLFLSVTNLPPGRTVDDKLWELGDHERKTKVSVREFLQMLNKASPR